MQIHTMTSSRCVAVPLAVAMQRACKAQCKHEARHPLGMDDSAGVRMHQALGQMPQEVRCSLVRQGPRNIVKSPADGRKLLTAA